MLKGIMRQQRNFGKLQLFAWAATPEPQTGHVWRVAAVTAMLASGITPWSLQAQQNAQSAPGAAVQITLDEAIQRAEQNEPTFAATVAENKASGLDRLNARAGMLPSVSYLNEALYTQPNGLFTQAATGTAPEPAPLFIANNAIHEYTSQAVITEAIGLAGVAAVHRADATAAFAAAQLEVARRGLVAAVTGLFYGLAAADDKLAVAQRAENEAADFTKLTTEREQAREAAHADVVKAQLQEQQRQRDLSDAKLAADKARLELAVLLFPDPHAAYTLDVDKNVPVLASREDVQQAAARNNPELRSALAALRVSDADVLAARAGYVPDLALNFNYGIDASRFAVSGPDKANNLGYSMMATLNIPVWDWLSTERKVKQSEIRRDAVKVALTATQKALVARLDEAYDEAAASRDQLASLDQSVATAGESLRLTKMRYTGGEATVLEVVDAQAAYVLAENAREDGRVRFEMALAGLQQLTGTM
jgi:outer membrane protein TolC